jgi:phosphoglycerate-specific signal transduction histidine kinase
MDTKIMLTEITEFLDRNLVLNPAVLDQVRKSLPTRTEEQLKTIHGLLKKTDEKQTEGLMKKLQEEPHYFKKLEATIVNEMYEDHLAEEEEDKQKAEDDLENELKSA